MIRIVRSGTGLQAHGSRTILQPCPTIMAGGLGGGNCSQYWLEDDGMQMPIEKNNKPEYRVPSMDEIRALPWNGFNAVSTFSGCGGSSTGYRMAGFRVLWASEFIDAARDSYRANKADYTILDGRDIRQVTASEILSAIKMQPGELDLFDGSPPCASFSTAGKREAGWGKVKKYSDKSQRTDDLFFEYARLIKGIQPKTFVAENVSGLVKGTAKGYFLEILATLKACGYKVSCRVLDAQWLGVPQSRQRTIFVGVREDLGVDPAHPKPLPYRYSVRDALPWIVKAEHDTSGQFSTGDITNRPCCTVTTRQYLFATTDREQVVGVGGNGAFGEEKWQSPDLPARTIGASPNTGNGLAGGGDVLVAKIEPEADISRYAIGAEWGKLKPGEGSGKYLNLKRTRIDGPSHCISADGGNSSTAGVCHPTEKRKFTIAELKRICGFPDDFILTGTYAQQWERLGRAVPPVMMSHIAAAVRDEVLKVLK
jgi:DNA (cytosine-5)-methyltransferase 1